MPDSRQDHIDRRRFVKAAGLGAGALTLPSVLGSGSVAKAAPGRPNLVFVLADQWRAQATGYAGNASVLTPNLDALAAEAVNFSNAVSGCPVCTPYRASLITGQYPLTHGLFLNDLCLSSEAVSIAEAYAGAGYQTAYIGKWHLDGHGRSSYIPPERRQGFEYWKVLECTHNYNRSAYYAGDDSTKRLWKGYDAIAQTRDAESYIREHAGGGKPFLLLLSWGPPHAPYHTAPGKYKTMYAGRDIKLRGNARGNAKKDLRGYYAHMSALDECVGSLLKTIGEAGIADNTIFVFTSDHGDMLHSRGHMKKQRPWDESIMVPFLLRYPPAHGKKGRTIDMPINTPDIMPTLLGLSGVRVPPTVEGKDYSGLIRGTEKPSTWAGTTAALITCPSPFGQWARGNGREYRGVRTRRYTYVRDLKGPWLLYDNESDPYQMTNLVGKPGSADLQRKLEAVLKRKLAETRDEFLPGTAYIKKWGYKVNRSGTVGYTA